MFSFKTSITQEQLMKVLNYYPDTGIFTWKISLSNRTKVSSNAGTHKNNGYIRINIDGYFYYAQRLAWLYMTGDWPKELIDHKNGIKDEIRFFGRVHEI